MSARDDELRAFYTKYRIDDQLSFYTARRAECDRAAGQALAVSAVLLSLSSAASALGGVSSGWTTWWTALAAILPAASAAVAGYTQLYAFEKQAKLDGDAVRAVTAAARASGPSFTTIVERTEAAFRQEHAQWGQLTSGIDSAEPPKE
ncbi:MAG TPA: SLATT domain-containing protein [Acidimicrobiales bacterium]|nr:SLATT domain-containing protein [Acidimicrobiales bacterium]